MVSIKVERAFGIFAKDLKQGDYVITSGNDNDIWIVSSNCDNGFDPTWNFTSLNNGHIYKVLKSSSIKYLKCDVTINAKPI